MILGEARHLVERRASFFARNCLKRFLSADSTIQGYRSVQFVAAPGNQPPAVAIALQPEAVAVVLHLVEPLRADRDDGRSGGEAEIKRLKHVTNIFIGAGFTNPQRVINVWRTLI